MRISVNQFHVALLSAVALFLLIGAERQPAQDDRQHASADDCEIIAAVGRAELNWDKAPQDTKFLPDQQQGYAEDCPWNELGVSPKLDGYSTRHALIGRPFYYSGNMANALFDLIIDPPKPGMLPSGSREMCTFTKLSGHWHLQGCSSF
jgi:hypothetical protein